MKLTVFGATGGTGTRFVLQALEAGHDVTAVIRPGATGEVTRPRPGLTVVAADVMDPDAVEPVVAGRDAVFGAIGTRTGRARTDVCARSARAMVTAMDRTGGRRLVVVSASGPHIDDGDGPLMAHVAKPLMNRLLRHAFDDMREMERIVRASGLDWTILRPPRLTDGPQTGTYRTAVDRNVRHARTISRADVAHLGLAVLADPTTIGTSITLGY